MTPPRNIQLFNRVVAVTLIKLYASFPNPLDLTGRDVGAEAAEGLTGDIEEQFQLMMETASNTIGFLVHEGFVRYDPSLRYLGGGPDFPAACLSLKGFTLLGATPDAIDESIERRPFIDQLHDAVEDGARTTASEVVSSLFTGALRLGLSAVLG